MSAIPLSVEDITPAWLSEVLHLAGKIDENASVTRIVAGPIGAGQGFVGELARLRLKYDLTSASSAQPMTLIAKLPSLDEHRASMSAFARFNEREHRFYMELADSSRIRVPRCYYSGMDIQEQRFVLLLEDLAAVVGDQLAGCSKYEAQSVVKTIAPFHAGWWCHERLVSLGWMPHLAGVHPSAEAWWQQTWDRAQTHRRDPLPAALSRIGEHFGESAMRALQLLGESPRTIVHGDYRLDNLIFSDDDIVVIDWQLASQGPAVFDLAFFLSGNLDPALRRSHEKELLLEWHDGLLENGVSRYSSRKPGTTTGSRRCFP